MPKFANDNEAMRNALHEAAHAAVALRMEIDVDFVTVQPLTIDGRACQGFCSFGCRMNHDLVNDPEKWLDRFAKAMLAGRASDELFFQGGVTPQIRGSWAGDSDIMMKRVLDLRDYPTWRECEVWRDRMLDEARQVLVEPTGRAGWAAIAVLLLARGRITGDEAKAAFFGANE